MVNLDVWYTYIKFRHFQVDLLIGHFEGKFFSCTFDLPQGHFVLSTFIDLLIKCYILLITEACCKSKKRMTDWFYSQINIDCLIKWAVFFQNIFNFWQIETMSTKQYMRWVRVNLIFRKRFYWSFGTKPQNDIIEGYGAAEFQKVFLKGARCSRNTPESSGLVFSLHSRHIRKRP